MNKLNRYFKGVNEEARRVRWPDAKTLWKSVAIVLIIAIVSALSIALFDWLTVEIMRAFRIAFPSASTGGSAEEGVEAVINWMKGVM